MRLCMAVALHHCIRAPLPHCFLRRRTAPGLCWRVGTQKQCAPHSPGVCAYGHTRMETSPGNARLAVHMHYIV